MLRDIAIIVATHKQSPMPADGMYLPLLVGAAGRPEAGPSCADCGYLRDDTGDNISLRNPCFGTQTGLYWAWKNLDAPFVGLVHYRRFFVGARADRNDLPGSAISHDEIAPMLERYAAFVPRKRRYVIETLASHYAHTHDGSHLSAARDILLRDCPSCLPAFDRVLRRRWGYMFNLMILRKDLLDDYCAWLFPVLFRLSERIDSAGMSDYDRRFCGRVSEILFNVWLEDRLETGRIRKEDLRELPYMEDVDWIYKGKAFLAAKFLHRKYGRSS